MIVNPKDLDLIIDIGKGPSQIGEGIYRQNAMFVGTDAEGIMYPIGHVVKDDKYYQKYYKDMPWNYFVIPNKGNAFVGELPDNGVRLAFQSKPMLKQNGIIQDYRPHTPADILNNNERSAIGVRADGRIRLYTTLDKISLDELIERMSDCVDILNLDGGGSVSPSTKWERPTSSALIAKEGNSMLIIDPGHGGKDPGGGSNELWKEKDMVLKISLYQYERFKELGIPAVITRTDDVSLSPTERTDTVKASGAKYCISNHINAASPYARGVETIHSIYSDGKLANDLYDAIVAEGMPGRRVFDREGINGDFYFMHRETGSAETVIVEYGFATNLDDSKLIEQKWERYAEAVVKAFCQFVGHKYEPTSIPKIQGEVNLSVNGNQSKGYLIDNTTYVPLRFVGKELGAKVIWNNKNKTAYIKKG